MPFFYCGPLETEKNIEYAISEDCKDSKDKIRLKD